jgi:hypothetical protein
MPVANMNPCTAREWTTEGAKLVPRAGASSIGRDVPKARRWIVRLQEPIRVKASVLPHGGAAFLRL